DQKSKSSIHSPQVPIHFINHIFYQILFKLRILQYFHEEALITFHSTDYKIEEATFETKLKVLLRIILCFQYQFFISFHVLDDLISRQFICFCEVCSKAIIDTVDD